MLVPEWICIFSTKKVRDLVFIDVPEYGLIAGFRIEQLDLLLGLLVKPCLDNLPDLGERPWSVNDNHHGKLLRIVTLSDAGGLLDHTVDSLAHRLQREICHV